MTRPSAYQCLYAPVTYGIARKARTRPFIQPSPVDVKLRSIEGTYDILPGAGTGLGRVEAWQFVESVIRRVMHRFAFEEIRTPVLEPAELVARGVGQQTDIVTKEMFSFQRGRTHYVLRPELTAPAMRAYLQHHLDQRPGEARLFYFGPCFRAERPQKGRYRQFHQFGAEVIGTLDARADAEVIAVMMATYAAFGLEGFKLRLNTLGDAPCRARYAAALQHYFEPLASELSATSLARLQKNPLRILDTKVESERCLVREAPRLLDFVGAAGTAYYERVKALLGDLGIAFVEDPFLVRGLDYYTHTAFELEAEDIGAQSALAGGGRYDGLAESIGSGKTVPAVGFAAGVERLFLALGAQQCDLPNRAPLDVFLVAVGTEAERWAFAQAQQLRAAGLRCSYELGSRSLKAQLRLAHRVAARHCVIVTDEEMRQRMAQVKNMETGVQQGVAFDALEACLRSPHH